MYSMSTIDALFAELEGLRGTASEGSNLTV